MDESLLIDAFTEAVRKRNDSALEDIGVHVSLSDLSSWACYVDLHDKMYDKHKFITVLKRLVFPSKYHRLGERLIDVQVKIQQEFLNVVIGGQDERIQAEMR